MISAPAGRIDTVCRLPLVVSASPAEKVWPRAWASMRLPTARPSIVPDALWLDSVHCPEISPPR